MRSRPNRAGPAIRPTRDRPGSTVDEGAKRVVVIPAIAYVAFIQERTR